jgi:hypothetical protein
MVIYAKKGIIIVLYNTLLLTLLNLSTLVLAHWHRKDIHSKWSWIGAWNGNKSHDEFVLLVLDWDGKNITGIINPGTDNIQIDTVELDPSDWSVTIEAYAEFDNKPLHYEISGTITQLELPTRSINGTWKSESGSGDFQISRQ